MPKATLVDTCIHTKNQSVIKIGFLWSTGAATRSNYCGVKFDHLQKSVKKNHILAAEETTFVDKMSVKKLILKKRISIICCIEIITIY